MGEKFDPNKHDALFQVGMFRTNVTTNYVALVGTSLKSLRLRKLFD